jgi:hypothetical protein
MKYIVLNFDWISNYEKELLIANDIEELQNNVKENINGSNDDFSWYNYRVHIKFDVLYSNRTNVMEVILKDVYKM